MKKSIKLGYEIKTGKRIDIDLAHTVVTGVTQLSGKTTTLESLIERSKLKAIVFKTKIGEKSFLKGTIIPPFFRDRSDWQFIEGLIEATIREKLRSFERAKIIQICKQTGGKSLIEFKKKVDERLAEPKLNMFEKDILTNVGAYLEIVLPKLQSINFSNELELVEGLNIIDLERFSRDEEVQSLIISSVADEVLNNYKGVILVIPESWKFIPQNRGNPCKLSIEKFIRQGATNNNFIWIDSQDMSGVDKIPLKQIYNWVLGFQSEKNEVKHTLDQIPLPKQQKPKADEIMTLDTGHFILATRKLTTKVYIQPFWLDDEKSKEVALGKIKVSEIDAPSTITPFKIAIKKEPYTEQPTIDFTETTKRFQKELNEMSVDFFNKIADIQEQINKLGSEIYKTKIHPQITIEEDVIVRKVLQKIPTIQSNVNNKEEIITEILAKIPKQIGSAVYEVAPLEKIKKTFLEESKNKIISDIETLSKDAKRALKYIESRGADVNVNEFVTKCFMIKQGGSASVKVSNVTKELITIGVAEKTGAGRTRPKLKERIKELMGTHEATEQEIDDVYNHILANLLEK